MPEWESMITIGRVVRPHGVRGHVVIAPETDFAEDRFQPGAMFFAKRGDDIAAVTIAHSRPQDRRWVVRFDGVSSANDAEEWRGAELRIPAETLRTLTGPQFYVHDLVGCRVETIDGAFVGEVTGVEMSVGTPVLVITTANGETMVPLAEEICRRIDIGARMIAIAPPEGLVELNWTGRTKS